MTLAALFRDMHNNVWATLYLTLIPSGLFLIIALILKLTKRKFAKMFLLTGAGLLFFPVFFIVGHFSSEKKEMKQRAGTFHVIEQQDTESFCAGENFDTLKLTLEMNGNYKFNYKPCFANKINGHWKWTDDMVGTYTTFDKVNDSLYLHYPSDNIIDTLLLLKHQKTYIIFSRVKNSQ